MGECRRHGEAQYGGLPFRRPFVDRLVGVRIARDRAASYGEARGGRDNARIGLCDFAKMRAESGFPDDRIDAISKRGGDKSFMAIGWDQEATRIPSRVGLRGRRVR